MLASMRVWVWPQNPFKKLGIRICAHNHKTMEVKAERSKGFLVSQPASPAHSVSSWQMRDTGGWYLRNDTQSRPLAPIGVNTLAHTCLTSTPTPVCHKCIFLNLHSVYIISKRGSLPPPEGLRPTTTPGQQFTSPSEVGSDGWNFMHTELGERIT